MNTKELLRELKYTRKKHENDKLDTFQTNITAMLDDVIPVVERYMEVETRDKGVPVRFTEPTNEARDNAETYCGECDYFLDEDSSFCPNCGFKLLYPEDVDFDRENEKFPTSEGAVETAVSLLKKYNAIREK